MLSHVHVLSLFMDVSRLSGKLGFHDPAGRPFTRWIYLLVLFFLAAIKRERHWLLVKKKIGPEIKIIAC